MRFGSCRTIFWLWNLDFPACPLLSPRVSIALWLLILHCDLLWLHTPSTTTKVLFSAHVRICFSCSGAVLGGWFTPESLQTPSAVHQVLCFFGSLFPSWGCADGCGTTDLLSASFKSMLTLVLSLRPPDLAATLMQGWHKRDQKHYSSLLEATWLYFSRIMTHSAEFYQEINYLLAITFIKTGLQRSKSSSPCSSC